LFLHEASTVDVDSIDVKGALI